MSTIAAALSSLRPGAQWEIRGELVYSNIVWLDAESTQPTPEEVAAEVSRLATQRVAEKRRAEIKAELQRIDADGARPAREIALALAAGGTASQAAVSKVQSLEAQAQTLRAELATLS